jgi:hypothetical protein
MEPNNDSELRSLLADWKAPEISASLDARVLGTLRKGWWHTLLHGYVRIPVPVACALIAVILAGAWRIARPPIPPCSTTAVAQKTTACWPDSRC